MKDERVEAPDATAVRVALWRALHVLVDSPPPILKDEIGLRLADPAADWQKRPDMDPRWTQGYRAAIVARARFVEDLVLEHVSRGVSQYVILGAGLDTFAQRNPSVAYKIKIFEIDRPSPQNWKRQRLEDLGFGFPEGLRFVPVDFEANESWSERLSAAGFDKSKPAVVAETGVSMYLTKEGNAATMREVATFAPGSTLAMTFLLTLDLIDPAERQQHEMVYERARASGTPFISFFSPSEITSLARQSGFKKVAHVSRDDLVRKYFAGRPDGLLPASGEEFLVATT